MKTEHEMCQFFLLQQWAVDENRTQNVSAFLTSTVGSPRKQNTKCQFFLLQQWAVHENRTRNVSAFLTSTVGSPRKQNMKCVSFSYFNSGQSMKTEHKMCQFFLLQQWAVQETPSGTPARRISSNELRLTDGCKMNHEQVPQHE